MCLLIFVLCICECVSDLSRLCSGLCVFICVWPHVFGDGMCSCICGELVCVITCGIGVVMSRVGEYVWDLDLSSILWFVNFGCVMYLLGRYAREVMG